MILLWTVGSTNQDLITEKNIHLMNTINCNILKKRHIFWENKHHQSQDGFDPIWDSNSLMDCEFWDFVGVFGCPSPYVQTRRNRVVSRWRNLMEIKHVCPVLGPSWPQYMEVSWNGGYPQLSSILKFPRYYSIKHPAIGVPPFFGNLGSLQRKSIRRFGILFGKQTGGGCSLELARER